MALVVWDDTYSIGIAEIDQQHRTMFSLVQGLHESVLAGRSASHVEPTLSELLQYCEHHFTAEESLMSVHQFPELANHRSEHRLITSQVNLFLEEQRANKPGLVNDLLEYLEDWIGIHILQHDMKYRDHLMHMWGVQFRAPANSATGAENHGHEKRRRPRLSCSVPVELHSNSSVPLVYAQCVNINQCGGYLRTWSPLPVNTTATARFFLGGRRLDVRICIRRSEPCVGIGISFLGRLPRELEELIRQLERSQPQGETNEATCQRLVHDCLQNITALEDVISETAITQGTAAAVQSLVARAHRLEMLALKHG